MSILFMIILAWLVIKLICPVLTLSGLFGWLFGSILRVLGVMLVILVLLALIV